MAVESAADVSRMGSLLCLEGAVLGVTHLVVLAVMARIDLARCGGRRGDLASFCLYLYICLLRLYREGRRHRPASEPFCSALPYAALCLQLQLTEMTSPPAELFWWRSKANYRSPMGAPPSSPARNGPKTALSGPRGERTTLLESPIWNASDRFRSTSRGLGRPGS